MVDTVVGDSQDVMKLKWSKKIAYGVGLVATDGSLSKDGRHIDLTSKDIEQLNNFKECFNIETKICRKSGGYSGKKYHRVQFSDVKLYKWLTHIGIHPNKSKSLKNVKVPDRYFFDYLRGEFDGDGSFYSYWDKRWKSSFMFYLQFTSASKEHLLWLNNTISRLTGVSGKINPGTRAYILVFAKKSSRKIIRKMYESSSCLSLSRKRKKVFNALSIDDGK